mgnify:CR=1 FL=1
MKKLTYTLLNVDGVARPEENAHLIAALRSADPAVTLSILDGVRGMTQQGDIWLMHDEIINDNLGVEIVWILDSQAALDTFNSTVREHLENLGGSFTDEEITFQDFASFAAANKESTFNRQLLA